MFKFLSLIPILLWKRRWRKWKLVTLQQSHSHGALRGTVHLQCTPLLMPRWWVSEEQWLRGRQSLPKVDGPKRETWLQILYSFHYVTCGTTYALTKISSVAWPSLTDSPFNCCCNCPMAWGRSRDGINQSWSSSSSISWKQRSKNSCSCSSSSTWQATGKSSDLTVPVGLTLSSLFLPLSFRGYNFATKNDLVWDLLRIMILLMKG